MCLQAVLRSSAYVRVVKQGRKHVHVRTDGTYGELLTIGLDCYGTSRAQGGETK
jgi:hypothetical protein